MKLPTISTPIYEVSLLSRKEPVKFRPFLVREQKLMLMAAEAKSQAESTSAIKQIAKNCILDEDLDIDNLPLVDLELLFLNFRARSMGEVISTYFKCKNIVEEKECGMVVEIPVNLLEVPVVNSDVDKRIMVSENVGIQLKIPTFEIVNKLINEENDQDPESDFKAAAMNIDYIFDENGVYKSEEASMEDLLNFIYSLPPEKYNLIEKFFERIPTIRKKLQQRCPKCSYEHKFVLEGLNDFFI